MRIDVQHRMRARWVHGEWYNHGGNTWFNFGIANPRKHAWWAFTVYVYLR